MITKAQALHNFTWSVGVAFLGLRRLDHAKRYYRHVAALSDDERNALCRAQPDRLCPSLFPPPEPLERTEGWIRYNAEKFLAEIERDKRAYSGSEMFGRLGALEGELAGCGFSKAEVRRIVDGMIERLRHPHGFPLSGAFLRQGDPDAHIVTVVDMTDELAAMMAGLQLQEER